MVLCCKQITSLFIIYMLLWERTPRTSLPLIFIDFFQCFIHFGTIRFIPSLVRISWKWSNSYKIFVAISCTSTCNTTTKIGILRLKFWETFFEFIILVEQIVFFYFTFTAYATRFWQWTDVRPMIFNGQTFFCGFYHKICLLLTLNWHLRNVTGENFAGGKVCWTRHSEDAQEVWRLHLELAKCQVAVLVTIIVIKSLNELISVNFKVGTID